MVVKNILARHDMTLSGFAKILNISRPTLYSYIKDFESGKKIHNKKYRLIFKELFSISLSKDEFEARIKKCTMSLISLKSPEILTEEVKENNSIRIGSFRGGTFNNIVKNKKFKRRREMNRKYNLMKSMAYELYKQRWEIEHWITPKKKMETYKDYVDGLVVNEEDTLFEGWIFNVEYTFDDYLEEFGYNGELYSCFNEFLNNEYQDEGYMWSLLKHDQDLLTTYLEERRGYVNIVGKRYYTTNNKDELLQIESDLAKYLGVPYVGCSYDYVLSHEHLDVNELNYRNPKDFVINYEIYQTRESYLADEGGYDGEVYELFYVRGNGNDIIITGV